MLKRSNKIFRLLLVVCLALSFTTLSAVIGSDKISAAVALPIKVNVGGPAADGMLADKAYSAGSWGYVESGTWTSTVTDTISPNFGYPTAMKSNRYYPNFSYKFDVPNGSYTVKLYFVEDNFDAANQRKFNVAIGGVTKLSNYDIWSDAGGVYKATEKVFSGNVVTGGSLVINFTGVIDNPKVAGIIVQQDSTTLPIKVNVGGPAADGMSADKAYTAGSWGYVESGTWTSTVTDTISPNFGYPTAMKSNRYYPNFSYKFDVPNGSYTVKLYFVEDNFDAANQRKFNVAIGGVTKLSNYDIWSDAGGVYKATEKVFSGNVVTGGNLVINFTGVIDNPKVAGIIVQQDSTTGITAVRAIDFLNSIGINSHIGQGTDDVSQSAAAMSYAGIRNVRDGDNASSAFINDLISIYNSTGIKSVLSASGPDDAFMTAQINASKTLANAGALLAVEGPNEPCNWAVTYKGATSDSTTQMPVAKYQRDLYAKVKADAVLKNYPVFQTTQEGCEPDNVGLQYLTIPNPLPSGVLMPAGTQYADYANLHNYLDRKPYSDNMAWENASSDNEGWTDGVYAEYGVTWAKGFNGYTLAADRAALPKVSTETGWPTDVGGAITINREQQGRLYLNLFLSQFKRGIKYTFVYVLRDNPGPDETYGIFDSSYNPKKAATYLHNLTTILADTGSISTPGNLNYSIPSQPATVHDLLLQKSNGKFELAVWNERASGSNTVTVNLGASYATVKTYDPTVGTTATQTLSNVNSVTLTLSDHPVIIELP